MTVIEALARAGSTHARRGRRSADRASGGRQRRLGPVPARAAASDANVIHVNVRDAAGRRALAERAAAGRRHDRRPEAQSVYVFGQVKAPGAYAIERGTTVLQALSLAGGVTDRGSTGRV